MASRYLAWLHRDERPEQQRELTRKERIANWWDYHIWHVVFGVAGVLLAGHLVLTALGVGKVKPDYQIAYVGHTALPSDTAAALESALASLGGDASGDGQTVVQLHQYIISTSGAEAATYGYAAEATLLSDLEARDSYLFLLEDPEAFQARYISLALLDGTLPEEGDTSAEGTYLRWADCPVLAGLPLGGYAEAVAGQTVQGDSQELLSGLAVARRGFLNGQAPKYPEGCAALWEALTKGAAAG